MIVPRNGSVAANCLLVVAGIVVGGGLTWWSTDHSPRRTDEGSPASQRSQPRKLADRASAGDRSASAKPSQNPGETLRQALFKTDPIKRSEALRRAGAAGADRDLAAALEAGRELQSERDRLDYHLGLIGKWADTDPEAAIAHAADSLPPGLLRSEAVGLVVNKWGSANPREAWQWTQEHLNGPLKERAMNDLVIGWTRRTPEAAAEWLTGTGLNSQPLYSAVGRTWAEQAPRDAAAWAGSLPQGVARQTAQVAVASEWASQEPAVAAAHYTEDLSEEGGTHLAIAITDVWATTNPAETAQWINSMSPGPSRNEAAGALATIWAASDIDAAVAWSRSIGDADIRGQVITHIGTTWGAIEPGNALDWLTSLPPDEAQEGIRGAFYSWAGTDAIGLNQWIETAPGDPLSDQARQSLGDVLTATRMPAAMNLALGMSVPGERDQAVARFFREWRKTDDPSAQEWLQASWPTLSSSTRDRLTQEQALPVVAR